MRPAGPRAAAVAALLHQEQGGYANLVLDAELDRSGLDRAGPRLCGGGVLHHGGKTGRPGLYPGALLPKGVEKLDPPVRAIQRSGLAQARFMQVPPSAAVNEAVKLVRAFGKASAAGLVNAVLRKSCSFDLDAARLCGRDPAPDGAGVRRAGCGGVSAPILPPGGPGHIREIFDGKSPDDFDEETLTTINKSLKTA